MDGILNIRKEKGFTSHDVVAVVRRILHTKKVGHTGTLDPDAEGVLPVCVGKATKLADIIMDGKKRYRAMVRLGITTTTEDAAGEVLEEKPVDFDEEKIRQAVAGFVGEMCIRDSRCLLQRRKRGRSGRMCWSERLPRKRYRKRTGR